VTSFGSDFVSLCWTAPGDSTVDLYQVRCGSDKTDDVLAFSVQPNITLRSLRPHTTYSFAVCRSVMLQQTYRRYDLDISFVRRYCYCRYCSLSCRYSCVCQRQCQTKLHRRTKPCQTRPGPD